MSLQVIRARSGFVGISTRERVALLTFVLLIGLGGGVIVLVQWRAELTFVYLAFLMYLGMLTVPLLAYRQEWGWFHPLVLTVLWGGLIHDVFRRFGLYTTGLPYHRALPGASSSELNGLLIEGLLFTALGLSVMYVGFFALRAPRVPRVAFPVPRYLFPKVVVIAAVSGVAFLVLITEAGGFGSLMLQRGLSPDLKIKNEIYQHWHFLVGLFKTACLVWLSLKPHIWKRPEFLGLFSLALFMGFAATGSRSGVIVPLIMVVVIWALHYRRIPTGRMLVVGVIGVAALGILGEFRTATRSAQSLADIRLESGLVEGVERGLDTLTTYAGKTSGLYGILGKVPEEEDHLLGKSYLSILTAPIPRAIWPEKPVAGGKLNATRIFNNPNSAIPPTSVGEAFWNFHIPGVIVVFFLWGMFLKWMSRFYEINGHNPGVSAIFVLTLFNLQPTSPAFYGWLHVVTPALLFLVFFCGVPRRARNRRRGDQWARGAWFEAEIRGKRIGTIER